MQALALIGGVLLLIGGSTVTALVSFEADTDAGGIFAFAAGLSLTVLATIGWVALLTGGPL